MKNYKPEGGLKGNLKYTEEQLLVAMNNDEVLTGVAVKSDEKMNIYINLGNKVYGIITHDEFEIQDIRATKQVSVISKVGTTVVFKVKHLGIDNNGAKYAMLSRKEAQIECKKNFITKLQLGQVIDAEVTHVESYGAFCDIGFGITALLPIKNICITRIYNLKEELKAKQKLKVVIKNIDGCKITLSQKELLGTWEEEVSQFNIGDTVLGTVKSIEEFGTFISLSANLAGLANNVEDIKVGDQVAVLVKGITPDKMKVKLAMVDRVVNENKNIEFNYKITDGVIKRWTYSPKCAEKLIETVFEE